MGEKEYHNRMDSTAGRQSDLAESSKNVHWDGSELTSVFPNAIEVNFSRDEVSLILGSRQNGDEKPDLLMIRLLCKIIMNPHTAKRLADGLKTAIHEYETRYGTPEPENAPADISRHKEEKIYEKENLLFQLIQSLDVEMGYERSFKISENSICGNRFLLGTDKKSLGDQPHSKIMAISQKMGMPAKFTALLEEKLFEANYIHFGFEESAGTCLYKVYLEFWETIKEEIEKRNERPGPRLLHLGLKWDVSNPARQSLTYYTWHPWLSSQEILKRVAHILATDQGTAAGEAAEQLISLASARIPDRDILYLEVAEEGNPRRSFDINVYRANLHLMETYPLLSMLCRRHSIPFDTFHSLYDTIKDKRFGHLAAGVDREGKGFFTVYYGVEAMVGEGLRGSPLTTHRDAISNKYRLPARKKQLSRVEATDDKASGLYRLVNDLGLRSAFERSFKFLDRTLLNDRFLLGFRRPPSDAGIDAAIVNICRQIDMPADYRAIFQAKLHEANIVMLGFEKNDKSRIYKVYLEFIGRLKEAVKQDPMPESVVIHNGFKWDVLDNSRKVATHYRAFHILRAADMAARLLSGFYESAKDKSYRIVDDILDLAGSRTRPGELLYFEASEEGNLRSSFDINMHLADLRMSEIYPLLAAMARHHCIDLEQFEERYEAVKTYRLGHLSGGTDREGRDFLTVYFGEREIKPQNAPHSMQSYRSASFF